MDNTEGGYGFQILIYDTFLKDAFIFLEAFLASKFPESGTNENLQ
jgi:hypothetical protein